MRGPFPQCFYALRAITYRIIKEIERFVHWSHCSWATIASFIGKSLSRWAWYLHDRVKTVVVALRRRTSILMLAHLPSQIIAKSTLLQAIASLDYPTVQWGRLFLHDAMVLGKSLALLLLNWAKAKCPRVTSHSSMQMLKYFACFSMQIVHLNLSLLFLKFQIFKSKRPLTARISVEFNHFTFKFC